MSYPLKNNSTDAWALRSDQGPVLTNADLAARKGHFSVGDQVIEVNWVNQNGWTGWVHREYGMIPSGNGLARSGLYTFGKIRMEITDGIVTGLWKENETGQPDGKD